MGFFWKVECEIPFSQHFSVTKDTEKKETADDRTIVSSNIESTHQKLKRVRSWYLYEQYKSLKCNQQHAAQQLKERSRQKRILRQELSERRARRRLGSGSVTHSESYLERSARHDKTPMSLSADDFESFHDDDDFEMRPAEPDMFRDDLSNHSHSKQHEKDSGAASVVSVVENIKSYELMANEINNELKEVKKNIKENINEQLKTVKQNLEAISQYAKVSDYESDSSDEAPPPREEHYLFAIWSKLVSFAYQITQLNHGKVTATTTTVPKSQLQSSCAMSSDMVLITCPYVSPIKFSSDDDDSESSVEYTKNTENLQNESNKNRAIRRRHKLEIDFNEPKSNFSREKYKERRYNSENMYKNCSRFSFERAVKNERASEPWSPRQRRDKYSFDGSTLFPDRQVALSDPCECCACARVANPMAKIVGYLDKIDADCHECDVKLFGT